jgi:hypothetical protein
MDPLFDDNGVPDPCLFAENNARELKIWGADLPDMRLLRIRGFHVWAVDAWDLGQGVVIGGYRRTLTEFRQLAARERRLTES